MFANKDVKNIIKTNGKMGGLKKGGGGQKSGQDENRVCTGQRTKECEQ